MNSIGRYELKFVVDETGFTEMRGWLHRHARFINAYPTRSVNSLYFDDVNYQSVRDNLSGVPERKKIRLRWYNNLQTGDPISPALEVKYRSGRVGYKKKYPVPEIGDELLSIESRHIINSVYEILGAKQCSEVFNNYLAPTLYVKYERQYFEDIEGLRMTIDRRIIFNCVVPNNRLTDSPTFCYPYTVIEFKFSIDLKDYVSELIRHSRLQPKRHSKYLAGLAVFDLVQYV